MMHGQKNIKINCVKVNVLFSAYVCICFSLQLEFELVLCEENNGGIQTSLVKSYSRWVKCVSLLKPVCELRGKFWIPD